ncbi:MAG: hypothetical protein IKJ69_05445 [Clostridia bacterium]|nr:hypothetical protein [Clostridia bacterium]
MKKLLCLVLTLVLTVACIPFAAAADYETRLYTVYGDRMLFQQNDEAVLAGIAKPGSVITATLEHSSLKGIAKGETVTKADGTFEVSFDAPSGSFTEYTIVLEQDGQVFDTLERTVFGELWLGSGQSNMQYPLGQDKQGAEDFVNGKKYSKWLRVLMVPPYVNSYGEIGFVPDEPQKDIAGAMWIDGQNDFIYNMSAVAFYFADEMLNELNMPIGILNASLGGSSIASWISRQKVDSEPELKSMLYNYDAYKESADWTAEDQNVYLDVGANYNHKIEAMRNFRPAGMIWYQGETDIGHSEEYYAKAMDVMQSLYTDVFSYKKGLFPLIYTNLAEYFYTDDGMVLPDRNIAFSQIQANRPESRATFPIYDVPVTYIPAAGVIHPECKKEVGERMALCAKGLVYDKFDTFTAATVDNTEIKDSSVYVTLKNVGEGLAVNGDRLYGFAICGNDGIYLEAEAEIVSFNTVKVWNESITKPVSVSYAYGMGNGRANLVCRYKGENPLPVSIFITDRAVGSHYWSDKHWMDCDKETIWHTISDANSAYYPAWTGQNVNLAFTSEDAYEGTNGIGVTADSGKEFTVKPLLTYEDGKETVPFCDADTDYSDYGTMSFYVRNNGKNAVKLDKVKFIKNDTMWHTPAVNSTKDTSFVIPADAEWHLVTLDLNRLYLHGNEGGVGFTSKKLSNIRDIELCFTGENADISIDSFTFTPADKEAKNIFDSDFASADNLFEYICVIVTNFLGLFAKLFR